jgi:ligand-binding SRPBCC domain-containing protein
MPKTFQTSQWLPFPVPVVFAFFANPQNLPPLMPAWQKTRIEELQLKAPPPPPAGSPARLGTGVGTTMILSFRALPGVPMRLNWHATIPEFEWNDHFCDEQISGPFHFWRHCHSVQPETRDGVDGTLVTDHVDYQVAGGPLGGLIHFMMGSVPFMAIFRRRHSQTEKLLPVYAQHLALRALR